MNRSTGEAASATRPSNALPGFAPTLGQQQAGAQGAMFYATAGQQATQGAPQAQPQRAVLGGQGFPQTAGALGRAGPPGFTGRAADPNDFPALGTQPAHPSTSSYAAQAQPTQQAAPSNQHPHLQQQMFMQQGTLAPPPGIAGPSPGAAGQPNGLPPNQALRGEDFPALGTNAAGVGGGPPGKGEDRMGNFMRAAPNNQPTSPQTLSNGLAHTDAATAGNAPLRQAPTGGPSSTTDSSWTRHSPRQHVPQDPIVRPVQQVLQSPVDNWDLKSLLLNIQAYLNNGDKGDLMFGVDLSDLGVDVESNAPLYPSLVAPWTEPRDPNARPPRIEEAWHTPACYHVQAKPIETKLSDLAEETLFYIFYSQPQDVVQLEVAAELYLNRNYRYHMEHGLWFNSDQLSQINLHTLDKSHPNLVAGPFQVHDPNTMRNTTTDETFLIDANLLEITRPAATVIEETMKRDAARSPNGSVASGTGSLMSSIIGGAGGNYQTLQAAR